MILREIERGGQVYFVHNRVQSIGIVARELQKLLPGGALRRRRTARWTRTSSKR